MKRILALLLTLTLVFVFVACTDEKDNTSEQTTSTITQTENKNTGNNTNTETTDSNTTDKSSNDTETTSSKINKPNTNNSNNTSGNVTVADRMEEAEISTIVLIKEGNDKNCRHTLTKTIDHRTKDAPSCTTDGYIISQCQQCECEWEYFVKAFGHNIDSHCIKKPTCVMCKKEFEGDVNPNDHRYIEYNTKVGYVAPTCCSEGYEGHKKVCMNCNFVFERGNIIPINTTNHKWISATCSKPKTCSLCNTTSGDCAQHNYQANGKCKWCQRTNASSTPSTPSTPTYTNVLIINDTSTISNKTIDTDVYITSLGNVTFNNITINGNIYCYGQLTTTGTCSAKGLYAYKYGSMLSCGAFDGTHGKVTNSGNLSCDSVVIKDDALNYAFNKWGKK